MKIVVLGTRGFPNIQGGVETHCEELYKRLGNKEHIEIVVYRRKNYLNPSEGKKYKNIVFKDFRVPTNKYLEALIHSFLGFIHSAIFVRPDIVHIHNIGPGLFGFLYKMLGKKVVMTYHSQNYYHQKWSSFAKKALLLSELISAKSSNAIIFVSEAHKAELIKKVNIKKSFYIPNGISYVLDDPAFSSTLLEEAGLVPKRFLLFVGRISPEKGLDYLINAYKDNKHIHHLPLVVAGGHSGSSSFYEKIRESALGYNIKFLGQKNKKELSALYRNCAAFILPSYFEGNSIVLLEAISYKAKIIASNIQPNIDVGMDQKNYFSCGDTKSLSNTLEIILQDQDNSYMELDQKYNWDHITSATLQVYKEVLNED